MPRFTVLPDEVASTLEKSKRETIDLSPFIDALTTAERGRWYVAEPDTASGETFDFLRRRTNQAKRRLNLEVNTKKGDNDALYYKVVGDAPAQPEASEGEENTAPRSSRSRNAAPEAELEGAVA